ncbi:MAG: hypothetical protein ORN98_11165 [Alphaproteobacteria bacterium]|nr:hypothetical protein [Alphaproteobacteria bacterium]
MTIHFKPVNSDENLSEAVERHLRAFIATHQAHDKIDNLYELVQREVERPLINLALELNAGNQLKAASMLGLNRNTLRKKMRELEISASRSAR